MEEVTFEEVGTGRYLILSDASQEYPQERLRITNAEMRAPQSGGKPFPLLTLIGEDSAAEFQVACFARDVKPCVQQWGKKPVDWGYVTFEQAKGSNRRVIVPCKDQNPEEEPIGLNG